MTHHPDIKLYSRDSDQAARLATVAVLRGDDSRGWALEYAIHRDDEFNTAESDTYLAAARLRAEL